jgi:uracil-DNA glycosylase
VPAFDPGYALEPFASLVRDYPGPDVYPPQDFRLEWGPIFHRGRLDGTAQILVMGQDPGAHESIARRILVGEAGQRVQGFLAKLGIRTRYVMINAFVYSVYGQWAGESHWDDPSVAAYRHAWLDALLVGRRVDAVLAFGRIADRAFNSWSETAGAQGVNLAYHSVPHPTYPESASAAGQKTKAEAMREMLAAWNDALASLRPSICNPEVGDEPEPYGEELRPEDLAPIPDIDLPPGVPLWMRSLEAWAARLGPDEETKRATVVVTVPAVHRPWAEPPPP